MEKNFYAESQLEYNISGWIYSCIFYNSFCSSCFITKIYELAEKYNAYIHKSNFSEGIKITSENYLEVKLIFLSLDKLCKFQTKVKTLIFQKNLHYIPQSISDEQIIECPILNLAKLTRIYLIDSEIKDCSRMSDGYEVNDEVKLRLLDGPNSPCIKSTKVLKFYIKPPTSRALANDPNNIVFMSILLVLSFAGISQVNGIPKFYIQYVSHTETPIKDLLNGKSENIFETIIEVIFYDEESKNQFDYMFKDHFNNSSRSFFITLYFQNPLAFKEFSDYRALETKQRWEYYDRIVK